MQGLDLPKIRIYRQLLGITLEDAAMEIGINISVLSAIERGKKKDILNELKRGKFITYYKNLKRKAKSIKI